VLLSSRPALTRLNQVNLRRGHPLKILFVDQTGQLGGGELSLLDVIKHGHHQSEIVLFSDGPFRRALEDIHVPVHVLSLGSAGKISRDDKLSAIVSGVPALFKLRNELASKARGFDVLYANSQKAFLLSALARRRGQPLIWHLRDMLTADHFSPIMRRAAILAGNLSASAIIMNSEATRQSFLSAGGKGTNTAVVYNGIDGEPFRSIADADIKKMRSELGLEGKFVVGVFGRLAEWKGQHILIQALASLSEVHAIIVGEALFGEQSYANGLQHLAQSQGVDDRVHFLGFRRDIPVLMKVVDVVIHSSTAPEPFGRVIVEGMLAGRPVIATRAGGVTEIVQDLVTGLLVTPGSTKELAEAITRLRTDSQFSRELVEAASTKASSVFSTRAMINGIQEVLRDLHSLGAR